MSPGRSRLLREFQEYQRNPEADIQLSFLENNLYECYAVVKGPRDSPYEDGTWKLRIVCQQNYPITPPKVVFMTKCFHPNVDFTTGDVCIDVLTASWSPAWTLQMLCRAIISLFADPNADSPLNCDAGNLIRMGDLRGFNSMARMYTIEYALENKCQDTALP
ncbi:putative ubiquitin conjugating enzyme E2 [Cardiosporidium cionae]|uniref:Ubiquitin conjugating enzyme E2 n=1 Tax=Cardiosporidium cionae TaxID=476202 RepID=A0ABQ7JC68_9APIC|nr:putative ubiquitin conjugating enzyme E2 [Cardiosporidium cionae]|eukprot:KAF8821607.1 putative ubiquitin conjugating enzyme E2 [Cardiosporidium cionae]